MYDDVCPIGYKLENEHPKPIEGHVTTYIMNSPTGSLPPAFLLPLSPLLCGKPAVLRCAHSVHIRKCLMKFTINMSQRVGQLTGHACATSNQNVLRRAKAYIL